MISINNHTDNKELSKSHLLVLISMCILMASSYGLVMNSGSIFVGPVTSELNIKQGSFAITMTITSFTNSIMSLYIPRIMKKFNLKFLFFIGGLILGFSTIALSLISSLIHLSLLSFIRGIGLSLLGTVPVLLIINNWFIKDNGKITSIVILSSGVTGAIFSPVFAFIISRFSWRKAYIAMGIIIIILATLAIISPIKLRPEESGLHPYGLKTSSFKDVNPSMNSRLPNQLDKKIHLIVFSLAASLIYSMQNLQTYYSGYALTRGYSIEVSGAMLSAIMIGNILSKILIGNLSDKIGPVQATIYILIINIISIGLLINGSNYLIMILGGGMYGSIFSLSIIGTNILTLHFFGRRLYADVFPKISFISTFISALISPLMGYAFDYFQSLIPVLMVILLFQLVNFLILLLLEKVYQRNNKFSG